MSETQQKLVLAARKELLEHGWEKTTGSGIRLRAKVSTGSWTHAFPAAKREVAAKVYEALRAELWSGILDVFRTGARSEATLRLGLETLLVSAQKAPAKWRLLFQLEAALASPELPAHLKELWSRDAGVLVGWVQRHPRRPPAPDADPLMTYALMFGAALTAIRGSLVFEAAPQRNPPLARLDALVQAAEAGLLKPIRSHAGKKPAAQSQASDLENDRFQLTSPPDS